MRYASYPHASGAKAKGKEPKHPPLSGTQLDIVFDEGHFEPIMGIFEKWTDKIVSPYLHLVCVLARIFAVFLRPSAGSTAQSLSQV
jgi:hypothetical protein